MISGLRCWSAFGLLCLNRRLKRLEIGQGFELEVEVDDFIDVDRPLVDESFSLLIGDFDRDVFQDAFLPLFLLYELLPKLFASGAPKLDVHKAGTEEAKVISVLDNVLRDDALAAVALN